MSSKQTVAPVAEPITLQDAKDFLRVDLLEDDDLITSLIVSARQRVETEVRRALVTQTWRLRADDFPRWLGNGRWRFGGRETTRNAIALPVPPLQSVSSITYVDAAGATQTLATSGYVVDADSEPGRVTLAYGASWPATRREAGAVTVTFVCGYGAAAAVPDGIKIAMRMLVTHWYTNRSPVVTGTIATPIPLTVSALLDPFRWGSYA